MLNLLACRIVPERHHPIRIEFVSVVLVRWFRQSGARPGPSTKLHRYFSGNFKMSANFGRQQLRRAAEIQSACWPGTGCAFLTDQSSQLHRLISGNLKMSAKLGRQQLRRAAGIQSSRRPGAGCSFPTGSSAPFAHQWPVQSRAFDNWRQQKRRSLHCCRFNEMINLTIAFTHLSFHCSNVSFRKCGTGCHRKKSGRFC